MFTVLALLLRLVGLVVIGIATKWWISLLLLVGFFLTGGKLSIIRLNGLPAAFANPSWQQWLPRFRLLLELVFFFGCGMAFVKVLGFGWLLVWITGNISCIAIQMAVIHHANKSAVNESCKEEEQ